MYAVAAGMYKLYPFYIIMYDIGISFTFTRKRVHPVSPSDNPGRLKVAHRMPFSMRGQADDRVLAAQIQLYSQPAPTFTPISTSEATFFFF